MPKKTSKKSKTMGKITGKKGKKSTKKTKKLKIKPLPIEEFEEISVENIIDETVENIIAPGDDEIAEVDMEVEMKADMEVEMEADMEVEMEADMEVESVPVQIVKETNEVLEPEISDLKFVQDYFKYSTLCIKSFSSLVNDLPAGMKSSARDKIKQYKKMRTKAKKIAIKAIRSVSKKQKSKKPKNTSKKNGLTRMNPISNEYKGFIAAAVEDYENLIPLLQEISGVEDVSEISELSQTGSVKLINAYCKMSKIGCDISGLGGFRNFDENLAILNGWKFVEFSDENGWDEVVAAFRTYDGIRKDKSNSKADIDEAKAQWKVIEKDAKKRFFHFTNVAKLASQNLIR